MLLVIEKFSFTVLPLSVRLLTGDVASLALSRVTLNRPVGACEYQAFLTRLNRFNEQQAKDWHASRKEKDLRLGTAGRMDAEILVTIGLLFVRHYNADHPAIAPVLNLDLEPSDGLVFTSPTYSHTFFTTSQATGRHANRGVYAKGGKRRTS